MRVPIREYPPVCLTIGISTIIKNTEETFDAYNLLYTMAMYQLVISLNWRKIARCLNAWNTWESTPADRSKSTRLSHILQPAESQRYSGKWILVHLHERLGYSKCK